MRCLLGHGLLHMRRSPTGCTGGVRKYQSAALLPQAHGLRVCDPAQSFLKVQAPTHRESVSSRQLPASTPPPQTVNLALLLET